jgi:hypothetical protein
VNVGNSGKYTTVRCDLIFETSLFAIVMEYQTKLVALVCEQTIPTERPPLVAKLMPTFADKGCCVVSTMAPHGHILGFLDRPSLNNPNIRFLSLW